MFDNKKALLYIMKIATSKGYTQTSLIEGIYDYSHFNRMCNGKENIRIEILFACADKLGIDYNVLYHNAMKQTKVDFQYFKNEFERFSQIQDYESILALYEEISKFESDEPLFMQLKKRIEAMVITRSYKDFKKSKQILYEALYITIPHFNLNEIAIEHLSETELSIINDIAICNFHSGDMKECFHIFQLLFINLKLDKVENEILSTLRAKVYLNFSMLSLIMKDYETSLTYVNEGINHCLKTNNYIYVSQLYITKAEILYAKGEVDEFKIMLEKSFVLSVTQNKTSLFLKALFDDVQHHQMDKKYYIEYSERAKSN